MSKEELDPYEKEVKGAIDEYNKRLNKKDTYESELKKAKEEETKRIEDKKVEEDDGGFFDEGSAFRTTAAIGTEVGLNTLLDLFSFIPPAQYAGGAAINYLAQRIRGGEFSEGEMIASGLASLLPGGAQAKSLGGVIGKGVARGALSGAIETGAADLIDTGELDAERIGTGALVGGAFGGIFSHIGSQKKVQRGIKYFQDRIRGEKFVKLSPEDALELGLEQPMMSVKGDEGERINPRFDYGQDVLANTPPENVKLLKELGLTNDESVFVLSNYYKEGSTTSTTITRDQAAAIESLFTTVKEFNDTKDLALPYFLRGMKGITRDRTPQLDHIAQLKASLPFFNNAKVSQFPEITKIILEEGVFGLGHQRGNFKYLEFDVHTVKSNYWAKKVGDNGEIFFKDRDISTPAKLRAAAKEFAKIINDSNNVVADAIEQYKFMNKVNISEEELYKFVDILGNQPIRRKYSIMQVRDIFKQMEEDGFIKTAKQSLKAEQTEVRSEIKEAREKAKRQERLDKDTASVERREEVIDKYIKKNPQKFPKTSYPFGMKDEALRELAEQRYDEIRKNRLIRENIQDDFFEAPKKKEAAIRLIMKSILNQQRRKK